MLVHLVLDGTADGPLGVALDVFAAAARVVAAGLVPSSGPAAALRQRVVSPDGAPVRSSGGRTILVDGALSLRGLGRGDTIVLAGLGATTEARIDALLRRADVVRVVELLGRAAARGVTLAASCSATFLLGAAGVLDGRAATTAWWLAAGFARRFPRVRLASARMVVDAGPCLTAGAALAHADLALALLVRAGGPSLAHLVTRYLVLDERDSQARYLVLEHLRSDDETVRALERYVQRNLARQLTLQQMARATATSPRTLARRVAAALGTTPQRFAQRIRMARAAQLLETSDVGVDEIAARVGYADAAAFRRVFRRELGCSPRAQRRGPPSA